MQNTEFIKLADETIENLFNTLEEADEDFNLDCDYLDSVLQVDVEGLGTYIINKNEAAGEIWMSSPKSGAHHFKYDDGNWVTSNNLDFMQTLKNELKEFVEF